jgi:two-component system sensor histidine kinase CiaH
MATRLHRAELFRSARLKLTLFYLTILLLFSLSLTACVRLLAEHEYMQSNDAQRTEVRQLILHAFVVPLESPNDTAFENLQDDQAAIVRAHLNDDLILINLVALVVGGCLSYWFAGRTLQPIEEAHETQKRFASDASHELRTPLANMKVENEVFLRQKHFSEAEARAQIESNLEEVQRLENLSRNLLALTQYEGAQLELKPLPAGRLLAGVVQHAQKSADAKNVQIEQSIAKGAVIGHEDSLTELVSIILDNAIKYGPVHGKVTLTSEAKSGQYYIRVSDEGPGVDPKDAPFIFDRLYRGDKARSSKVGGYGLGLSLAKLIADANRASVTVGAVPKGGAMFTVRLPLAK